VLDDRTAGLREHDPQPMGAMGRWLLAEGLRPILVPRATQAGIQPMPRPIAHHFHIVHFQTDLIRHLDAAPRPSTNAGRRSPGLKSACRLLGT
jgi:hypothetical protein